MITLFENIPFIDMWPISLRSNGIVCLTVLHWIILVICTNDTILEFQSNVCNMQYLSMVLLTRKKGPKWRDSKLTNVFYSTE